MKTNLPEWRQVIQDAAYQATLNEAELRWGSRDILFNYRWEHIRAVVRLATRLAHLTGADQEIVEAAAWLHDSRKRGRDDNHGQEGAMAARQILIRTDFPASKIDRVVDAIAKHVGLYRDHPLEPLEAAVLWDADKLSKMGSTAILHFTGYRIAGGKATTERLVDRLSDQPWQALAVQSFHTEPARAAGLERLRTFQDFWKQAALEFDGDDLS